MTKYESPILCSFCKHLNRKGFFTASGRLTSNCSAYPFGIPDRFLSPDDFHILPAEGDRGIQYETDGRELPVELKARTGLS